MRSTGTGARTRPPTPGVGRELGVRTLPAAVRDKTKGIKNDESPGNAETSVNEADGTRTRNHRIDRTSRTKKHPLPRSGKAVPGSASGVWSSQSPLATPRFSAHSRRNLG